MKMPASIKKYIRTEKARIRREVMNVQEQDKLIADIAKKFAKHNEGPRDIHSGAK